jgi:heme/copper-type cytochrome/quinol oxidase subunit 2
VSKKLIVIFVVGFVTLTVVVAVLSARNGEQRRPSSPATQTNKTLNLDTSPPKFPNR